MAVRNEQVKPREIMAWSLEQIVSVSEDGEEFFNLRDYLHSRFGIDYDQVLGDVGDLDEDVRGMIELNGQEIKKVVMRRLEDFPAELVLSAMSGDSHDKQGIIEEVRKGSDFGRLISDAERTGIIELQLLAEARKLVIIS